MLVQEQLRIDIKLIWCSNQASLYASCKNLLMGNHVKRRAEDWTHAFPVHCVLQGDIHPQWKSQGCWDCRLQHPISEGRCRSTLWQAFQLHFLFTDRILCSPSWPQISYKAKVVYNSWFFHHFRYTHHTWLQMILCMYVCGMCACLCLHMHSPEVDLSIFLFFSFFKKRQGFSV